MSGQTVSMKKIAFLLSVSVGMSTGAVTVPLLYPHTLPRTQAYCLEESAAVPACWVHFAGGSAYVYVYQDGKAYRRMVGAATCPDGTVQLCFGVSAGDWLLAGAELSDGGTGSHPAGCIKATPCCLKKKLSAECSADSFCLGTT